MEADPKEEADTRDIAIVRISNKIVLVHYKLDGIEEPERQYSNECMC